MKARNIVQNSFNNSYLKKNYTKKSEVVHMPILGVNKIIDSKNSWILRCIWLTALIITSSLCCSQLYRCFTYYFSIPVFKQVNIVRSHYVNFPAIYLCFGAGRYAIQAIIKNRDHKPCSDNTISCWIDDTLDRVFTKSYPFHSGPFPSLGFSDDSIHLYEMCNEHSENCESDGAKMIVNKSEIESFWGKCHVFNTSKEIAYRGPFTYVKIKIKLPLYEILVDLLKSNVTDFGTVTEREIENSLDKTRVGATIAFYNSYATNRQHFLFYDIKDIYLGFETDVQLRQRQFELINRSMSMCDDENKVVKCLNDCIERKLSKICSPPYYTVPNTRKCEWSFKDLSVFTENFQTYTHLSFAICNCSNICSELTYSINPIIIKQLKDKQYMSIKIYFADSNIEKTTEKYCYDFTSLLSDIGGSLGFFLGFCCLTFIEVIEFVAFYFLKLCNLKIR